ncbi:NUDIX hydrolase [Actinophytocola sp.]|uniref:NUDIX domain-containing protein n=1 Tax=Actinophytocola sp. TaxID=1872138 RepID=UPI0025C02E37|nr:NUDIX hydrolase [Actinophytocola sp.]
MGAVAGCAAGALFFDDEGRVLVVEPTYKPRWEIPGGMVEPGETPHEGCVREVAEELGLSVAVGRLLVVDWAPHPDHGDKVLFVFDGGPLRAAAVAAIRLPADELAAYAFVAGDEVGEWLPPRLTRRVTEALRARADGITRYLENGVPAP